LCVRATNDISLSKKNDISGRWTPPEWAWTPRVGFSPLHLSHVLGIAPGPGPGKAWGQSWHGARAQEGLEEGVVAPRVIACRIRPSSNLAHASCSWRLALYLIRPCSGDAACVNSEIRHAAKDVIRRKKTLRHTKYSYKTRCHFYDGRTNRLELKDTWQYYLLR
jgi:hypothetical protein